VPCRAVYEIMWENTVEPGRPQITIWRRRTARWIHKATNTHSEYVTLIAFALQRWLEKRTLRVTLQFTACLQLQAELYRSYVITTGTGLLLLVSNLMTYVVLPRSCSDSSPGISASNPRRLAAISDSSDLRFYVPKNCRCLVRDCTHAPILFLEFPS